ncbi:MAG: DUF5011 domain-containing protein, partial [Kangiellaceae bacterium]|nr:DUF5011 domain-containing protein [Kangiellaceae bacterium]
MKTSITSKWIKITSVSLLFSVFTACGGGGDDGNTGGGGGASDTVAPVITLTGDNPQIIIVDAAYTELGATAQDNVDGNISANIAIDASAVDITTVGSYSVTYNISDAAGNAAATQTRTVDVIATDTMPDAFSFIDQINVALNTLITSNSITISGIDAATPISISSGEYSIDSGSFTSTDGTVLNGQSIVVQGTSSPNSNTITDMVITIGGVSDTFSVTTIRATNEAFVAKATAITF